MGAAEVVLIVIGVFGVTLLLYLLMRFVLAAKRGQLPMSAFNTFTGRWTDSSKESGSDSPDRER